jgi:chemotaxis protein methyltransferase CheR
MPRLVERADVERFRDAIVKRTGLHFDDGKLDFLTDVVQERMRALSCATFDTYLWRLTDGRTEIRALASHITVGETYFFRYWDHFRAFAEVVLPARAAAPGPRRLRVLSAGCASGEEAHSLAILIRQHLPNPESWELKIRGIDINPIVIEKAGRGIYSPWSLRDAPPELTSRYFRASGRDFELDSNVRAMASFEERNLADDDPAFWCEDAFDVVFCRNVMMYFRQDAMVATVARIARSLSPGGFLFLGHAETLRGISQDFHLRHTHETFYYQRRDAADLPRCEDLSPMLAQKTSRQVERLSTALNLDDTSWIAAIQRASNRIEQLSREPTSTATRSPSTAPRETRAPAGTDLGPALDLLRQERFAEAMDVLPTHHADSGTDLDARLLRAVLLTHRGLLRDAERTCVEILAFDELNAGAHYLMALCREHAGDRDAALQHDQAAIYLDAGFAMPHLHIGLLARRAGDRERARRELALALLLLTTEDSSRVLLFGGGFSRDALLDLCRAELRRAGEAS